MTLTGSVSISVIKAPFSEEAAPGFLQITTRPLPSWARRGLPGALSLRTRLPPPLAPASQHFHLWLNGVFVCFFFLLLFVSHQIHVFSFGIISDFPKGCRDSSELCVHVL